MEEGRLSLGVHDVQEEEADTQTFFTGVQGRDGDGSLQPGGNRQRTSLLAAPRAPVPLWKFRWLGWLATRIQLRQRISNPT